jgi:hypothetical protein
MSKLFTRIVAASAIAAILLLVLALPALSERSPFVGSWMNHGEGDGSTITLHIGGPSGDGTYNVVMIDDGSTACGLDEEGNFLSGDFTRGRGIVSGNVLTVDNAPLWCMSKPPYHLRDISFFLTYQGDETLFADWGPGHTFDRQGGQR